jgi:hypothetical protein
MFIQSVLQEEMGVLELMEKQVFLGVMAGLEGHPVSWLGLLVQIRRAMVAMAAAVVAVQPVQMEVCYHLCPEALAATAAWVAMEVTPAGPVQLRAPEELAVAGGLVATEIPMDLPARMARAAVRTE